tara:strand:- start:2651 stop:4354 length:1704 start_codon:yes stop_codon:yes gene_type:complete
MATRIITKYSSTASAQPTAGDLSVGELAVNVTDRRMYTKDTDGNVQEVGASSGASLYRDNFTGDGSTVAFTLAHSMINEELVDAFIDGVYQSKDNYTLSGAVVTFSTAPHIGAEIEMMSFQTTSISETKANYVEYTPAGTGATLSTVQAKLRESVSVKDFGAVGDGVTDDAPAFRLATAVAARVMVPTGTYLFGSAVVLTNAVELIGDGQGNTWLHRNYSPVNDYDGIFNIRDGGTLISMRDMTLRSLTGQTGGCLLSIVNTDAQAIGQFTFTNMGFTTTGTETHEYTIYMDGTARTTAPIGIRGVDMFGCSVFGGGTSTILAKGVLKWSFIGGGCYPAGGAATSNVLISGSAAVPTQSFQFLPADCSCPISLDYTELGVISCGVMGAITNTANTVNVQVSGYSGSVGDSWQNCTYINTTSGIILDTNAKITNLGTAPTYALEMFGQITGYSKAGTVTQIGQAGVGYSFACPDTQTWSFDTQSGKLFWLSTGSGHGVLVFADYLSTTITLLADPSSKFQASATPASGYTGLFKSASDHTISVKNNTGGAVTYTACVLGSVSATVDPA